MKYEPAGKTESGGVMMMLTVPMIIMIGICLKRLKKAIETLAIMAGIRV
jgi:hypothetical protein